MIQELTAGGRPARRSIGSLFERILIRLGGRLLNGPAKGSLLLTLPSGRRVRLGAPNGETDAELRLNSYALLRKALLRGSIGFAESYIDGDIETSDVVKVFRFFLDNEHLFMRAGRGVFKVRGADRLMHLLRRNSLKGSRRNIAEHYDLGNDFFAAWLDPDCNYSSGIYRSGTETLEEAQIAKQDLALSMLGIEAGDKVLEIGCGWGGMARRVARTGARVTAITLSREQLAYAREEADRLDLADRIEFHLRDYRHTSGNFDAVVSIEMIEAVGEAYWPTYFRTIHDRLRRGGMAAVQAITIDEERFDTYRNSTDFIQRYIFPGGLLPTKRIIRDQARQAGLEPVDVRTFGPSYAETLREWRRRFEATWPEIAKLGFDERFRRMWRYYLGYCEIGFDLGMIDVGLYQLQKPLNR